jgi:hypothetical protein
LSNTFIPPLLEEAKERPAPKQVNDDAFYAAMSDEDKEANSVENYEIAKGDLEQKGHSDFVEQSKSIWQDEKDTHTRNAIESIMGDASVPLLTKKSILTNYATTGDFPATLRDKYIQKTASVNLEDSVSSRMQQDFIAAKLDSRKRTLDREVREKDIDNNRTKLKSFLAGGAHLYSGVRNTLNLGISDEEYKKGHDEYKKHAKENPITTGLGYVGALISTAIPAALISNPLVATAAAATLGGTAQGSSKYAELGTTSVKDEERLQASAASAGLTAVEFALPIFRAATLLSRASLNGMGNVLISELDTKVQNEILSAYPELQQEQFDPKNMTVNAVMGAVIGGIFGKSPKAKSAVLEVPPGSPAATTAMANPEVAQKVGMESLADPTGKVANALGTDKGTIVHDWAMSKVMSDEAAKLYPDLAAKIIAQDSRMREVFTDFRYDPNTVNATARLEDNAQIYEIKKSFEPHILQSSSTMNVTDHLSTGVQVFGTSKGTGFTSGYEARKMYNTIALELNKMPLNQQGGKLQILNEKGIELPLDGKVPAKDGPYYVRWEWKKEYDDLSNIVNGMESVHTVAFGKDVSGLARSTLGRWLFPTGRSVFLEKGAGRGIERSALLKKELLDIVHHNIANTPHGKEMDILINKAEGEGKDFYSPQEMSSMFPHLTTKEIDSLFTTHTHWRRLMEYFHNFANRETRNKYVKNNMEGVYNELNDGLGFASTKIDRGDYKDIKTIWDFETGKAIPFSEDLLVGNRVIVRLGNAVEEPGMKHEFGIVGGSTKLGPLPFEVLPKIPGWSPRKVKEPFFVDMHPKELIVNGLPVKDLNILRANHTKTKAAARTEEEANQIKSQLEETYPDHVIEVRPERQDTFGKLVADYEVQHEMLIQSKRRGEKLPSLNGDARLEDRLVSATNLAGALGRMGAFREWDEAFQEGFKKKYAEFLDKGQFPTLKTDIRAKNNMSREINARYRDAIVQYEYYTNQKNFETLGDFQWNKFFWNVADIFEQWKIPAGAIRDLGKEGNLIAKYPKMLAQVAYISMNPTRQWVIQPAQLAEMYAMNPLSFKKNIQDMMAVRMVLMGEGNLMKHLKGPFKAMARKASTMSPQEVDDIVLAIQKSGLLQSIDMNVLVHGIFKDTEKMFTESKTQAIYRQTKAGIQAVPRATRAVGFDFAELTNRIGLFIIAKDLWQKQNPGKDWKVLEHKETIANEALRLSGTMNRAGNLPYQQGALAVFFQFQAISQKLLMNLIQDNATMLSKEQRIRLAATRFILYGGKYGVPGGVIAYTLLEKYASPEVNEQAEKIKRGLIDYTVNNHMAAMIDPDTPSDIMVTKGLTPYAEGVLPYFDFISETFKLFDDKPSQHPRYPGVSVGSSIATTIDQVQGWWTAKEIVGTDVAIKQSFLEIAELASGWGNMSKGIGWLGIQDSVSSFGNKAGHQYSAAEAYAKMFGLGGSNKEQDLYKLQEIVSDRAKLRGEVAKDIHKSLMNIRTKLGTPDADRFFSQLNTFMSVVSKKQFTEHDRNEILKQVIALDRRSFTEKKTSIFMELWKNNSKVVTDDWQQAITILKRSVDPKDREFGEFLEKGQF